MSGGSIASEKSALRTRMRETIGPIARSARALAARRAADIALRSPPFARVQLVLAYRAMNDEIDVDPLVRALCARGARIAFPLVLPDAIDAPKLSANVEASDEGRTSPDPLRALRLLAIDARDPLSADPSDADLWRTDRYGIRAPNLESPRVRRVLPRQIDAVIVPGRAFDARGARLGRGKGFYDALLARLRPDARAATIGLAFEAQVVDRVPEDERDARVAWIATERRLRRAVDPERPRHVRAITDEIAAIDGDDAPRAPDTPDPT